MLPKPRYHVIWAIICLFFISYSCKPDRPTPQIQNNLPNVLPVNVPQSWIWIKGKSQKAYFSPIKPLQCPLKKSLSIGWKDSTLYLLDCESDFSKDHDFENPLLILRLINYAGQDSIISLPSWYQTDTNSTYFKRDCYSKPPNGLPDCCVSYSQYYSDGSITLKANSPSSGITTIVLKNMQLGNSWTVYGNYSYTPLYDFDAEFYIPSAYIHVIN